MSDFARWPLLSEAFSRLGRPVVVVDLETTGGNFYQDRITEVALVRLSKDAPHITSSWSILAATFPNLLPD